MSWFLSREVVEVVGSGQVMASGESGLNNSPENFEANKDAYCSECHVSHALGVVSSDLPAMQPSFGPVRGGILGEEMGLGRTVEIIALMCLRRRQLVEGGSPEVINPLKVSAATLESHRFPSLSSEGREWRNMHQASRSTYMMARETWLALCQLNDTSVSSSSLL